VTLPHIFLIFANVNSLVSSVSLVSETTLESIQL